MWRRAHNLQRLHCRRSSDRASRDAGIAQIHRRSAADGRYHQSRGRWVDRGAAARTSSYSGGGEVRGVDPGSSCNASLGLRRRSKAGRQSERLGPVTEAKSTAVDDDCEFRSWSGARDLNRASRSRTDLMSCPRVSPQVLQCPPELATRFLRVLACPTGSSRCREFCDPSVTWRR